MIIINWRQALARLGIATSALAAGVPANAAEEQPIALARRHLEEAASSGRSAISDEHRFWVESHAGYIADLLEKADGGTWRATVDIETGFVMVLKDYPGLGGQS